MNSLHWFKSSYSSNEGPDCVEVAITTPTVHIRDSKNPALPHLTFDATPWENFLAFAGRG
ncbi:DUF397 domain-containing protein [Streptomyces fumanus]|uniref:DUF397 domain-containing protein n=1 Tax=Streptomyces fumanus TaxID=67302 RepID=UPI0034104838